jgi:hypothetical protein
MSKLPWWGDSQQVQPLVASGVYGPRATFGSKDCQQQQKQQPAAPIWLHGMPQTSFLLHGAAAVQLAC